MKERVNLIAGYVKQHRNEPRERVISGVKKLVANKYCEKSFDLDYVEELVNLFYCY